MKVRSCMGILLGATCVALGCTASGARNTGETSNEDSDDPVDASAAGEDSSESSQSMDSGTSARSAETHTPSTASDSSGGASSSIGVGRSDSTGDNSTSADSISEASTGDSAGENSTDDVSTSDGVHSGDNGFEVSVHLASEDEPSAPTTVGIVTWSIASGTPSSARVEFGLTTDYGMVAPVDVAAPELLTLLLGMKPEQTYHFRVVATVDGIEEVSQDFTLTTGAAPDLNGTALTSFSVLSPEKREPGFILTSFWGSGTQTGRVVILDQDGDIVWWYAAGAGYVEGVAKLALSSDGKDLWIAPVAISGGLPLKRIGLDGMGLQEYTNTRASHDVVPIAGQVMAYFEYEPFNKLVEINRAGEMTTIFTSPKSLLDMDFAHHLNAISYDSTTDTYAVSSLHDDVYLFPRSAATDENTVTLTSIVGPNTGWGGYQHRSELLPDNHLLVFANREGGEAGPSTVVEFDLDEGTEVWRYEAEHFTNNFGDVQRLPSGNTLITFSNERVIQEVTPEREMVLEVTAAQTLGYATWRPSLYASAVSAE